MSKPTPRPWKHFIEVDVSYDSRTGEKIESRNHWIRGPEKTNVAIAARLFRNGEFNSKEAEANAAHIVKCVNMHEELVQELKNAKDFLNHIMGSVRSEDRRILDANYESFKRTLAKSEVE